MRFPDAVAAASLLNTLLEGKFPAADGIIKKLSLRVLRGEVHHASQLSSFLT